MPVPPDTPCKVYYISGNDTEDDPAYGGGPIMRATLAEVQAWLRTRQEWEMRTLSVRVGDNSLVWGDEALALA